MISSLIQSVHSSLMASEECWDRGGGGGENEVNSNVASVNRNIFDAIDSIQIEAIGAAAAGKQRERMNSVDSTHSVRSYDSTGLYKNKEKCLF